MFVSWIFNLTIDWLAQIHPLLLKGLINQLIMISQRCPQMFNSQKPEDAQFITM